MVLRLSDENPEVALDGIGSRLAGVELDPGAAGLAQGCLDIVLHDLAVSAGKPVPEMVRVADALCAAPRAEYDLVLANPPYGRLQRSSVLPRELAEVGRGNAYVAFAAAAVAWTKPGGAIALITPSSLLSGMYSSALRRLLAREAPPVAIDFVDARKDVFAGAIQETVLSIFARCGRAEAAPSSLLMSASGEAERTGDLALPPDHAAPWIAPRSVADRTFAERVASMPSRLRDYGYSVSTGPLVWNRHEAGLRFDGAGECVHPLVWSECVAFEGFVHPPPRAVRPPYSRCRRACGACYSRGRACS